MRKLAITLERTNSNVIILAFFVVTSRSAVLQVLLHIILIPDCPSYANKSRYDTISH